MRTATDLAKLNDAVQKRIARIKKQYDTHKNKPSAEASLILAFCVLELDNLTVCALRDFTVSCLTGARTRGKTRITVARHFPAEEHVSAYILSVINTIKFQRLGQPSLIPRKEEPVFRDPKEVDKMFLQCGTSNLSSFQTALSLNAALFSQLPTVRNFYGHRKANTWEKVRGIARTAGVSNIAHPDQFVTAQIRGAFSVFEDWTAEAQLFFEQATA